MKGRHRRQEGASLLSTQAKGHSHVLTICLCLVRTGIFAHKGQNQRRTHNSLRNISCMCEFVFFYVKWRDSFFILLVVLKKKSSYWLIHGWPSFTKKNQTHTLYTLIFMDMIWSNRPTMAGPHLATNQACKIHAYPPTSDRWFGDQGRNEEM